MPDPVDELYALPLQDFIAARDRLAAELSAAKQHERAREVKALRRPTVAAWVVNQLSRRNRVELRRLIDAGEVLRQAQSSVLRRGNADELRAAAKRRREALHDLRALADKILSEAGSPTHAEDILATLEVASVDPKAAKAVAAGRLSRELPRRSGFGESEQLSLLRSSQPERAPEPRKSLQAENARKRQRARLLSDRAKRLEREAARSETIAARVARRAATVARRVDQLRAEVQAAADRLRRAESELDRVRAEESRATERAKEVRVGAAAARARVERDEA